MTKEPRQFHMMGWAIYSKKADKWIEVFPTRSLARVWLPNYRRFGYADAVIRRVSILDEGGV